MENSETRPRPGAPPRLDQPKAILEYLLDIEIERLQTAIRIERERKIVFPETTVIIRDILKLHSAIQVKQPDSVDEINIDNVDWDKLSL